MLTAASIGFSVPSYTVNECEGQVSIVVVVKGSLKRRVALRLSTSDLTANGKPKGLYEQICVYVANVGNSL